MNPEPTADYRVEPLADRHDRSQFCCLVVTLDRNHRGRGLGEFLLMEALRRALFPNRHTLHQVESLLNGKCQ